MFKRLVISATPFLPIRTFNQRRESFKLEQAFEGLMTHPTEFAQRLVKQGLFAQAHPVLRDWVPDLTKLHYACTYMYVLREGKFGALGGSDSPSMKRVASQFTTCALDLHVNYM